MAEINNKSTKRCGFESNWKEWPFVSYNSLFYFMEKTKFVWMLPNPMTWRAALVGTIGLILFIPICGFRNREVWKYIAYPTGYAASLFPFILVPRTTYVYHYLISLIFGVLCFSVLLQLVFSMKRAFVDGLSHLMTISALALLIFYIPVTSAMECSIKSRTWKESLRIIYNTHVKI